MECQFERCLYTFTTAILDHFYYRFSQYWDLSSIFPQLHKIDLNEAMECQLGNFPLKLKRSKENMFCNVNEQISLEVNKSTKSQGFFLEKDKNFHIHLALCLVFRCEKLLVTKCVL